MKFVKSFLMGTGAVVLAGLVLTLVAPRAAHAIAATAVQVENTVSSPVVSQAILPGTPFTQSCQNGAGECSFAPAIPSGYIFHATQQFAYAFYSSNQTSVPSVVWFYSTGGTQVNGNTGIPEFLIGPLPGTFFALIANHDWYVDSGNPPAACDFEGPATATYSCGLIGYLTH